MNSAGTYIAVKLRQRNRRYAQWLGRQTLDGSISLIAEFASEHDLKLVVAKLNDTTLPDLTMDPEQPDRIDFHSPDVVTGEAFRSHPDSVRAHNQRWPNDPRDPHTGKRVDPESGRKVRKSDRNDQRAHLEADAGGAAGAQPADAPAGDGPAPDGP